MNKIKCGLNGPAAVARVAITGAIVLAPAAAPHPAARCLCRATLPPRGNGAPPGFSGKKGSGEKTKRGSFPSDSAEYRAQGFLFTGAVRRSALKKPFAHRRILHDMLATTAIADSEGAAMAVVGSAASMEEML